MDTPGNLRTWLLILIGKICIAVLPYAAGWLLIKAAAGSRIATLTLVVLILIRITQRCELS